jgi:prepilin-type N-terminal cleavage/methylation domain-containing protein
MNRKPKQPRIDGFTLVEILVAAAVGAALITAAVIGFATVSQLPLREGTVNVSLPSGVIADLYGTNLPSLTMGGNPNYFQSAQARRMKDRLMSDVSSSSAVFCLGRNATGAPALRPADVSVPQNTDFRTKSTPSAFREFLVSSDGAFASVFPEQQDGALLDTTNASIYCLGTLASVSDYTNRLTILATYEIDFVPSASPSGGTVASVRRYSGTNTAVPTDYYHVFYPGEVNGSDGFRPVAAFFGRQAAASSGESDPFARAVNQPFTFVWWPDPLLSKLGGGPVPVASTDSARANYTNMAGRTSLFLVLPAFPSL